MGVYIFGRLIFAYKDGMAKPNMTLFIDFIDKDDISQTVLISF